ncbi:MAG: hypothetical protein LWX83_14540, partial [Anaerolineae bacterium]|nr:hypothetical protein [Anaerolineae bacterium]
MILYAIIAVVVLLVIAIGLVIIGLRNPEADADRLLQERLEEFNQKGENVSLEKIEMSQPFSQRVIFPLARSFGQFVIRFTPQNALLNISKDLELAGSPASFDPQIFLALQIILSVFLGGMMFLVFTMGATRPAFIIVLLITVVSAALGFAIPYLWLKSKI